MRVFYFYRDWHWVGHCNKVAGFGTSAHCARSERGPRTKFVGITIPHHPPVILNIPWQSPGMFFFAPFPAIFTHDISNVYRHLWSIRPNSCTLYTLLKIAMPLLSAFSIKTKQKTVSCYEIS